MRTSFKPLTAPLVVAVATLVVATSTGAASPGEPRGAFRAAGPANTTVDFEQHPAGTVITDQHADLGGPGQGVVFGPLPTGTPGEGLHPVIRVPPAGQAQSGSQVADLATCVGCEFFTPRTTGTFVAPRSQISVRVGYLGEPGICTSVDPNGVACGFVSLRAFDATGKQVAESSVRVTRGAGIKSLLSVSTPSPAIVGFEISGRPQVDDSKPLAIDDLSVGAPGAATPDFTLNPATTSLIIEQGGSATIPITIGRLGGSSGDVALSAKGLPAEASAGFAPNPAPGTESTLTLSADPLAPPATRTISITGNPQAASAGPAPRSFILDLTVQQACPRVSTGQELVNKLAAGLKCIFVTGRIDLAMALVGVDVPSHLTDGESALVIPDGVTLMGGRSPSELGGTLAMSWGPDGQFTPGVDKVFMLKLGANTRVTGLRLEGPNTGLDTKGRVDPTTGIFVETRGVRIDSNEIFGWQRAGVEVANSADCNPKTLVGCEWAPLITENYIHSNVQCSLGYGVLIDETPAGFARIERNVFAYSRHHVAASGGPGAGYIAELNFAQDSGPTCDGNYNQHFDVHGEFNGYGGTAGTFFSIRRNTIRGAQSYGFDGRLTRPAFELRGTPESQAIFTDNVVAHRYALRQRRVSGKTVTSYGAVRLEGVSGVQLLLQGKLVVRANRTCVDTAGELAVGDFNGDGRDDVFQAVGTLWVYSPSGEREWFVLNDSDLRLASLGLGDFDGDGRTDVFFRQGDRWLVSYGGVSEPTPLPAGSRIDIKRYRLGDFDGDGKTDVFRANGSRFFYSSAGATEWQPLAVSRLGIGGLRFGDFDGDGKTDVFSLANSQWSVSFGGSTSWRRLNRTLSSNLGSLVFADFDGDGKTDVARANGRRWELSSGGATPWRTLASGRSEQLSIGMLFGDFDGDGRDDVLKHGDGARRPATGCSRPPFRSLERFSLSSGGAAPLEVWSRVNMR